MIHRTINHLYIDKCLIVCLLGFCLLLLSSCCEECKHRNDGLAVYPTWNEVTESDVKVTDAKLWIYNADTGELVEQKQYGSAEEQASQRFLLPKGNYRILSTANFAEPFTIGEATRAAFAPNQLMFSLSNPSASPDHAYYGVTDITIDKSNASYISKSEMRRMLAELTVIIEGVPDYTAITGKVLNVAKGILPLQKNEDGTFGTASSMKEECDIPLSIALSGKALMTETLRLMPTANGFHTTQLFIQLIAPNGIVSNYDIEAPIMKSGGKYQVDLKYEEMKPYMYLEPITINDWTEGWVYRGEILNPEKK